FQGNIMALAKRCKNTIIHTKSPALRIEKIENSWFVYSPHSRSGPFDAVVINAPPWESKKIVDGLPWAEDLVAVLGRFECMSHRLTIHTDPAYVHKERKQWVLANVGVETDGRKPGNTSELSIWLGSSADGRNGMAIDIFKSWTSYRRQEPREIAFERTFQH